MVRLLLVFLLVGSGEGRLQGPPSPNEEKLMEIRAYRRISERLASSGQMDYRHIQLIKEAGFDVVVNLATADKLRNALEGFLVTELGLTYVHIPVPWENPNPRDLELFFDVMDANRDRRVFVHCFANMRASAFVYLYRTLRLGEPEEAARADLAAIWDPSTQPHWAKFMQEARARQTEKP